MSDDRELVERLAAIDATPRASWVAELRARSRRGLGDRGRRLPRLAAHDNADTRRPRTDTVRAEQRSPVADPHRRRRGRRRRDRTRGDPRRRRDTSRPTVTDRDRAPDVPPRALPNTSASSSRPGRTSSTRSREHRRRGSSPPSAPGGGIDHDSKYEGVGAHLGPTRSAHGVQPTPSPCSQTPATGSDGYHPGPVDTVDGLVAALSEQGGWADVTAPSDISIDGYFGKAFQRTAPADMSDCEHRVYGGTRLSAGFVSHPDFRSWESGAGRRALRTGRD